MPFERYDVLLQDARKNKYAIGAFNIFAMEFLPAILETAEEEKSPVLLQINPRHFYLSDLPEYIKYIKSQIDRVSVPVGLNLDHGSSPEVIDQGIRAGFPSVMYDGSKLPYEENLINSKTIVAICSPQSITVEAELGTLNDEGLELTPDNRQVLFTDPDKAAEFVNQTGVHALAVSIGNAHGFYKGKPDLDFERLAQISRKTPIPLVLHGGSGISDEDIKKAISLGINKINIYTEMSAAAYLKVKELTSSDDSKKDYPSVLFEARSTVKKVVSLKMNVFGSKGKA